MGNIKKKKTVVVNKRLEEYDVDISRPSKWGNPFKIGQDGNRKTVVKKHKKWILQQPDLMNSLHELVGRKLGCHCWPKLCHGDNLIELIEKLDLENKEEEDFSWG